MNRQRIREKILALLDLDPGFKEILVSNRALDKKRAEIRALLFHRLDAIADGQTDLQGLEWILARDTITAVLDILSTRNERLAGFSFLQYLDGILHGGETDAPAAPSAGFLAEVEHLLKGLTGKTGIYQTKPPAFIKREGRAAAILRSRDLSHMAAAARKFMESYPSGLDKETIRQRSRNKQRILKYFNATELEWEDWKWHTRHIIRDADTLASLVNLTGEEYEAVAQARRNRIPFGITPYYLSLMDREAGRGSDYAVRAQVIPTLHYVGKLVEMKKHSERSMDFMLEKDTSPVEGVTRRYPMIVILKPVLTCPQICVYCQRNWEIEDVYSRSAVLPEEKLAAAIQWIADTPDINEVLITGGDPFILSRLRLEKILRRLAAIPHIRRIRLGTRTLVTLPQRITEGLVRSMISFHIPGKREITIVTHFEHTYEVTPQAMEAVQKFRRYGIEIYNQMVFTFFNSRKFEAAALRDTLRMIGVTPYYTFNTKGKEETDEYRAPIARLQQEQKEEARIMPGTVRTDEIVFNVPRLGKNYLRAAQHHSLISILPDGRRVYEFHPWEKKLALADTFLYTDVSIHSYLKRLRESGEDTSLYRSIWYYY